MLTIKKYAAIDIGSNAMRLLITNIVEEEGQRTRFSKSSLVRVPIRLGQDVFTVGEISDENINRMVDAMKAYNLLMGIHKVEKYMAFATSAMREAYNASDVVELIKERAGIDVVVIGGKKEAAIIASTDIKEYIESDTTYLFIDVGGGSTELTLFNDGQAKHQKSFKIGTIRLLNNIVSETVWAEMERWITEIAKEYRDIELLGSGGNINKLFKLSGKHPNEPLTLDYMTEQYDYLKTLSYEEKISILNLNSDRADVIEHATRIYRQVMFWSKATYLHVPKIGLSDGIVKAMYRGLI